MKIEFEFLKIQTETMLEIKKVIKSLSGKRHQ